MNREQIIKALGCCLAPKNVCEKCPIQEECIGHPLDAILAKYALSLIKELTKENEAFQKEVIATQEKADKAYYELACEVENLRAENDRLRAEAENQSILWKQHFESIYETAKETVRADTVRKMQYMIEARCIEGGIYPAFVARTIDKVAQELLEESHDDT